MRQLFKLYVHKFENLDEIDNFLGKYVLLKWIPFDLEIKNSPLSLEVIKKIINK